MESTSSLEKRSHTEVKATLATTDVDVAAQLTAGKDIVVDPKEAARIRYAARSVASYSTVGVDKMHFKVED